MNTNTQGVPADPYELLREASQIIMRLTAPVMTGKPGLHAFEFRMRDIRILHAAALYIGHGLDTFDQFFAPQDPNAQAAVADFLKRFSDGDTNQ